MLKLKSTPTEKTDVACNDYVEYFFPLKKI